MCHADGTPSTKRHSCIDILSKNNQKKHLIMRKIHCLLDVYRDKLMTDNTKSLQQIKKYYLNVNAIFFELINLNL